MIFEGESICIRALNRLAEQDEAPARSLFRFSTDRYFACEQ